MQGRQRRIGVWACRRVGVVLVLVLVGGGRRFLGAQRLKSRFVVLADLSVRSHREASGKTGGSRERLSARQLSLISGMAEEVDRPIEQNTP